ncbi:Gfo/Idh/MocA family oxidoreductase [Enterococcus sp. AZ109]|uniref:Gfo/Idh/MocA family oxidoreductase n=1 Tax=Enterococcus sp. AZ109 TaxID=2774634 RepID=UPI003F2192D9
MAKKVKIGQIGLGRLGYDHAKNTAFLVPGAELVAVCDMDEALVKKAQEELDVPYGYTSYEEMLKNPEIEAVTVISSTDLHPDHVKLALEAGKHVFTEKPLGGSVEKCKMAEKAVEAHPELKFMIGFMRRYDHSYQLAKKKIENGDIGRIIMVRSYSQDPIWNIEGAIEYGPKSGGQFIDMSVHDIDLIRWFTGGVPAKSLWAIGGCFEFQEYKNWNDGDNVSALMQLEDDTMAFMFAGRAAAHGTNVETEIIGTRGTLRIGSVGTDSMLEVLGSNGVCRECYTDFQIRWRDAYVNEINEFVDCVLTDRQPGTTVYDGTKSLELALQLRESFETGKMITL